MAAAWSRGSGFLPTPVPAADAIAQSPPPRTPSDPNTPDFLQPAPLPIPVTPDEQSPVLPTPTPTPAPGLPTDDSVPIAVRQIDVVGSSIFDAADFAPILQEAEGRSLTLSQLRNVADAITQLYLDRGYLTSRAVLVNQQIVNGVVQIRVIEGSLERIDIEGATQTNAEYIRSRIALGGRTPLSQVYLENQLRLLRLDPLFDNVEASLRAGTGLGQSILTVRVTEANRFNASFSADNFSSPAVGSERFGIALSYRNLTGWGDEILGSYFRSTTGGSNLFDFSYRIPLNPMNGTLQLRVAPSDFRVTSADTPFDISGNNELYELSFRQPLIRTPREELALSLGFTYRSGEFLIDGIQINPTSTTSVFKLGQDYVRRDPRGAWVLRSQFSLGTGLLDASSGADPNGQFFSWLGQVQRVQILDPNNTLIFQGDLQLTPDPLLSSEQFVIGGGQSLRGFRQNVRSGDNGFRVAIENRTTLSRNEAGAPTIQVAPFIDLGAVWNDSDNPAALPDQNFLAGIGLGLIWQPTTRLSVRVDAALPLVDLSDRGNNAQDYGFYFSVNFRP